MTNNNDSTPEVSIPDIVSHEAEYAQRTGNELLDYYNEHSENVPNTLKGFNGAGWNDAYKAEKLIWATYEAADKFGYNKHSTENKKGADYLRKDVIYSHFISEALGGGAKKLNSAGTYSENEALQGTLITETVLGILQVAPRLAIAATHSRAETALKYIQNYHNNLPEGLSYEDEKQKKTLLTQTDPDKVIKAHKDFLNHNREQSKAEITKLESDLKELQASSEDKKKELNQKKEQFNKQIAETQRKIDAIAKAGEQLTEENKEQLKALQSSKMGLQSEIRKVDALVNSVDDKLTKQTEHTETETKRLDGNLATVDTQQKHLVDKGYNTNFGQVTKFADVGYSALGTAKYAANLAAGQIGGQATEKEVASSAALLGYEAAGMVAAGLEAKDAKYFGKSAKALALVGAAAGAAGSSLMIANIADQLNNPNLSEEERNLLKAEIGLQSVTMVLSSVSGVLSVAQASAQAGSKAASMLGKAVPMLGAVAAITGAINPAKWAEFSNKEDRIDDLKDSDDHSAKLLRGLLGESLTTEKTVYALSTVVDMTTGIGSAALAATGVGAGAAIILGLVGGAVSGIIQAVQQPALEALADKYAEKMRTAEDGSVQSIEDFFDGSFEQSQEKTKKAYEEFFNELVSEEGGYDSVFGLGSQGLTETDLALAAMTKTAGEMNKTAKHFFEQYKADGGWQDGAIQLREVKGNDEIVLADHGGGKHYLTFMTPLMASGRESTVRKEVGKHQFATTLHIHDIAGYTVIDRGSNSTTFNVSKVINTVKMANGRIHKIEFNIKAGAGDDTYFAYDSEVDFDGGAGIDTASYTKLDSEVMTRGLNVNSRGKDGIDVTKHLSADSGVYRESINKRTEKNGKRTETVEYRSAGFEKRDSNADVTDHLSSVEILHGTSLADALNLSGNDVVQQLHGFGGDDVIVGGRNTKVITGGNGDDAITGGDQSRIVAGGSGDDVFEMSKPIAKLLSQSEYADNDLVYIDGGQGTDLVKLSPEQMQELIADYTETARLEKFAAMIASLVTAGQSSGEAFQNMVSYLMSGHVGKFDRVVLSDVENVQFNLTHGPLTDKITPESLRAIGVTKSVYHGVKAYNPADLANWAANHEPSETKMHNGSIEGNVGTATNAMVHMSGQFHVVAGKTYSFQEKVDDVALLVVDGQTVLTDGVWNRHTTGSFTATETGYVDFDFYAKNNRGPSGFKLAVKEGEYDFRMIEAEEASVFLDMTQSTYNNACALPRLRGIDFADLIVRWVERHQADSEERMVGELQGDVAQRTIQHTTGKIFVTKGQTYSFREDVDDFAVLDIDGVRVLNDSGWNIATTGSFTATKTGYVSFDFYAANNGGKGNYSLEIKAPGDDDFKMVKVSDNTDNGHFDSVFKTAQLTGTGTGSDVLDSTFFAVDYNTILDTTLKDQRGLPFKTLNTTVDTYNSVSKIKGDAMQNWADNHIASQIGTESDDLIGKLSEKQMKHFQGQIYLEAGKDYTFKETVDDYALLTINGETVLSDNTWNKHTENSFSVEKAGYYEFNYYVTNWRGPGNYKLEVKTDAMNEFVAIDGNTAVSASLDASGHSKAVRLIGDVQSEKLKGSNHNDFIFGHRGNDTIEGGMASDFMLGGEGHDTFIFNENTGHDIITETSREDWLNNTIQTSADLSELKFHRYGDDLVIHSLKVDHASLTLADYFDFRGNESMQQRIVDRDGDVMMLDASHISSTGFEWSPIKTGLFSVDILHAITFQVFQGYSQGFSTSYRNAMDSQFIKDARGVIGGLGDMVSGEYAEDQQRQIDVFLTNAAQSFEWA